MFKAQKRAAKDTLLKELETKRNRLLYDRDLLEGDSTSLMTVASNLSVPLSPNSYSMMHPHDRRKLRTHTSRRHHHANGLGNAGYDDIFSNKRSKKDGRATGTSGGSGGVATPLGGGYDSEQTGTTTMVVGPGGRVKREDGRDKVMNTFKVSEEKNLNDLAEIRKAIGASKSSARGNKKKY